MQACAFSRDMRFRRHPFFLILSGLVAHAVTAEPVKAEHAVIELLAEPSQIVPGETFNLAVRFDLEPHWHIYWKNPGASGLPPEINWTLPTGFEVGEAQWPAPERIVLEGLVSYGYENRVTFIVPVKAPDDLEPGAAAPLRAEISYLICKEICLPGEAVAHLELPVGDRSEPGPNAGAFEETRASQPLPEAPFSITLRALEGNNLTVGIEGENLPENLYFYPDSAGWINPNLEQVYHAEGRKGRLELPLDHAYPAGEETEMTGILQSQNASWHVRIPGAAGASLMPERTEETAPQTGGVEQRLLDLGLPGWLLLAFAGGVILNVMPCVLPVLSLKALSLLRHSEQDRGQALAHGAAYTLGVVASFVALAAALFSLRALGESVGWGFQLQNPGFVLALALVFFLFGLNLMGVFDIGSSLVGSDAKAAHRKDLAGSFAVGVLAAVVGAPCVGPFVGGVSGIALQADTLSGLLIFATLGLGMASPFLALAACPQLVAYFPKPGPWMESLKQSMGFLLMAALVFLVYLLGESVGLAAVTATLILLLVAAIAAWIFGRWGAPVKSPRARMLARLIALALIVGGFAYGLKAVDAASAQAVVPTDAAERGAWAPWSSEAVENALAEGSPVFVDFTATWCLICQVNKKTALRAEATRELFKRYGIVSLYADWTRRNPAITAELERFERSGVPLYLLYRPDGKVAVLPQNLTNGRVREAVERLLGPNPGH